MRRVFTIHGSRLTVTQGGHTIRLRQAPRLRRRTGLVAGDPVAFVRREVAFVRRAVTLLAASIPVVPVHRAGL